MILNMFMIIIIGASTKMNATSKPICIARIAIFTFRARRSLIMFILSVIFVILLLFSIGKMPP